MPRPKKEPMAAVRLTVEIPKLMRQAIRERERLSKSDAANVVRGILLATLRAEMDLIERRQAPGAGLKAV